jgi:hypothetical protein
MWYENITINGYEFACYEKYVTKPRVLTRNITEDPFDTLTFNGLVAGATIYVICIIDSTGFNVSDPNIFTTLLNKDNKNCFSFSTMYDGRDPATKAAYAMAVMIASIFLLSLIVKCKYPYSCLSVEGLRHKATSDHRGTSMVRQKEFVNYIVLLFVSWKKRVA